MNLAQLCCFHDWTDWQQSSLTCGQQLCQQRTRKIATGVELISMGVSIFDPEACNKIHAVCPNYESAYSSCVNIDCREFDFKIIYLYFLLRHGQWTMSHGLYPHSA